MLPLLLTIRQAWGLGRVPKMQSVAHYFSVDLPLTATEVAI